MPLHHWLFIGLLATLPALALPLAALPQADTSPPANQRLLVFYPPHHPAEQAFAGLAAADARPIAAGRAGAWLVAGDADAALTGKLYHTGAWLVLDARAWLAGCLGLNPDLGLGLDLGSNQIS